MGNDVKYAKREEESCLHNFAQHNEHCEKVWGLTNITNERAEFQRDRERIVNAKAFRRMVDKAQIFTSSKGDHYRTRMTHTMEVAQIARSIANSLKLNIDLTEAIALGHDIGHTPFGHQGERTLQEILNHRVDIGLPIVKKKNVYGGFKHNFQSVRVLTCLEEKYALHEGLDISYQVLEGVLKHTSYKQKQCDNCADYESGNCFRKCCDIKFFLGEGNINRLYMDIPFPTTLEGQVVAIADEIAQRSHDVDDAMSAGLMNYGQLYTYLEEKNMGPLLKLVKKSYLEIEKSGREYVSKEQIICARIISDIVNYLVNDVIEESSNRIKKFSKDEFYECNHRFSEVLIDFSNIGKHICDLLESMVKRKVISNPEIAKFDYNADKIVKSLFQVYYQNPKLLHEGTLKKISIEIYKETGEKFEFIDGEEGNIQKELKLITHKDIALKIDSKEWKKHVILVRAITDYIAGMTDSYARNEYASFYRI